MLETIKDYLLKNPNEEKLVKKILKECGNSEPLNSFNNSYFIKNEYTYLIFRNYSKTIQNLYFVDALFTLDNKRNRGNAKILLRSLPKDLSFIFDTFSPPLMKVIKDLRGREISFFNCSQNRKQFYLNLNNDYSRIPKRGDTIL